MENKFDLIEKYLMNDMSVEEINKFEKQLSEDPNLREEFLLQEKINKAISESDVMNLRESLIEITSNNYGISLIDLVRKKRMGLAVAATIIILISVSLSVLFPRSQTSNSLINMYYSTYPALANIRSAESIAELDKLLDKSFTFYEEHNYKEASESFSKILIIDDKNVIALFYMALCELENNNLEISKEYLSDLIMKKDHLFWEQAHWYLAMIYLKQEDYEKAKSVFEEIIMEEMVYKTKAKRIIRKLD